MATLDVTSFQPALKQLYPNGLAEVLYPKCPLFGWLPKKQDFYGEFAVITPMIAGTRGAHNFGKAIANKSNVQLRKFAVTRVSDYAPASVDAEAILASSNDKGAIARALDTQIRGAMYTFRRSIAYQLYHNGGGARAQGDGAWTITGQTITLADVNNIVHFEVDMTLEASATDGLTGTVLIGTVTIASIDRGAGTITTVETNISTEIPGITNSSFLFREGDFGASVSGLDAWIPSTAPLAGTTFFGVDRSVDPVRLAGIRFTGVSSVLEETVIDAVAEADINGAEPDTLFMNSKRMAEMLKSMNAKTWVPVNTDIPGISYKALEFATSHGMIKVIGDPNCPYARGYLLERDTLEFKSLKECPHFAMDDGKKYSREVSADGIEFRVRAFHNLLCHKPGHNMVITW